MSDIHSRLQADHERLAGLWASYAAIVDSGGELERRDALAEFESSLLAHFEGEEKYLFPVLADSFPEEIIALREEHELIKRQLAELVGAPEVRSLDEVRAARLVATLKRHATRENHMLYTLVNDSAGSERYRQLAEYLEQTYASLRSEIED